MQDDFTLANKMDRTSESNRNSFVMSRITVESRGKVGYKALGTRDSVLKIWRIIK